MNLNELAKAIHQNTVDKGFYENQNKIIGFVKDKHARVTAMFTDKDNADIMRKECEDTISILQHAFFAQKISLIHAELSEAIEADREDRHLDLTILKNKYGVEIETLDDKDFKTCFEIGFKHCVGDELADVIIHVLGLAKHIGVDIQKHVELKMRYNTLRPVKHNKAY